GKKGAVCTFIYQLIDLFGVQTEEGILIDFQVTNEDIAGFCGISTRNSVNRIIHDLKEEKVIDIKKQKIVIYDQSYLADYIDR
ncbi:helix-turn-helix domain-containing protein, partial [Enterococcus faecalis]